MKIIWNMTTIYIATAVQSDAEHFRTLIWLPLPLIKPITTVNVKQKKLIACFNHCP